MAWFETSENGDPVNMAILKKIDAQKRDKEEMENKIEELKEELQELRAKDYAINSELESLDQFISKTNIAISNLMRSLSIANSETLKK